MTTYLDEFLKDRNPDDKALYIQEIFNAKPRAAQCVASNTTQLATGEVVLVINTFHKLDSDTETILK